MNDIGHKVNLIIIIIFVILLFVGCFDNNLNDINNGDIVNDQEYGPVKIVDVEVDGDLLNTGTYANITIIAENCSSISLGKTYLLSTKSSLGSIKKINYTHYYYDRIGEGNDDVCWVVICAVGYNGDMDFYELDIEIGTPIWSDDGSINLINVYHKNKKQITSDSYYFYTYANITSENEISPYCAIIYFSPNGSNADDSEMKRNVYFENGSIIYTDIYSHFSIEENDNLDDIFYYRIVIKDDKGNSIITPSYNNINN